MKSIIRKSFVTAIILLAAVQFSQANISLPEIFSDNMVLQQKSDVILWGWAKTGEKVVIKADWMDSELTTNGSVQGTWRITIKNTRGRRTI